MKYCIILLSILVSACQPSLDISPKGYSASSSYYKTAGDAEAAVTGAYSILQTIYRNETILAPNVSGTDDGIPFLTGAADRVALWKYGVVSTNTYTADIWRSCYVAIQYANIVISRVPGITMDETIKKQYVGEAKFLRALHYLNLVRFYGEVPLVTAETTSLNGINIAKSKVEDVYNQIEADLKDAETVLPKTYPASNQGRATQGAAKALLAKSYLTRAGSTAGSPYWAQAAAKSKEVIDSQTYDLWVNYADVFDLKNRGGKESVFEILYVTDIAGNYFSTGYAPRGAPIVPNNGFGICRVSKDLFERYSDNDQRKAVSFLTSYVHPTTNQRIQLSVDSPDPTIAVSFWKLADPTNKVALNAGKSFPYMRYSEVLLIYAEALNESGNSPSEEAYAALNKVRQRAGLDPLFGLSKATFKEAVLEERRLEFCFEAHRWFDLVRTGRLVNAIKADNSFNRNAAIQPFHVLYPIPQREIDANTALKQNDGY